MVVEKIDHINTPKGQYPLSFDSLMLKLRVNDPHVPTFKCLDNIPDLIKCLLSQLYPLITMCYQLLQH